MGFTLDKFRKDFPHLVAELEKGTVKISIDAVRVDGDGGTKMDPQGKSRGYIPDVIDFIRRCSTEKEAEEIIDFMEERGEVSAEYAGRLRGQLKEKGVRSFGTKKRANYYLDYFKRLEKQSKE